MKFYSILVMIMLILANLFIFSLASNDTEADSSHRYPIDSFGGGVSTGLPSSGYYDCIAVGNINGDSYLDMVSGGDDSDGGSSTTGLYFYAGNGAGSWTETTITATSRWAGVEIVDCDNDGNLEVYAANQAGSGSGVGVWEYSGSSFSTSGITSPLTSGGVNYVNILNITGGSGLDLVAATHSGMNYYQGSGSSPISWTEYSSGLASSGQFTQSAIGDLNNDGRMDIVAGDYGNGLHIFTQDSGGTSWTDYSTSLPSTEQSGRILGLAVGDVNKDGNADIVFDRRTSPQGLFLLLGNGGGVSGTTFNWTYLNNSWVSRPGGTFYQMHLKDIDKDGDLDLLAPQEQYGLHLYLGNGSNFPGVNFGWSEVTGKGLPTTMKFFGSNLFDFDNDGDLDVAGCTWGDGIHVYQNNLTLPDVPIARAGSNQIVFLGNTADLDGTGSSDPQDCPSGDSTGNILTYDWNFTAQPPSSSLTDLNLTPSDSVAKPSFIPTHVGDYWLSLRVRDTESHWGITEDQVRITVLLTNQRPIADAGSDQQVETNTPVTLDGSGSSDVEDIISQLVFDWNVSGSNPAVVTLNDESAIQPTFTAPNTVGVYEFTLVVQDTLGNWSIEDSTNVSIVLPTNINPVADAGADFTAYSNTTILLNGSGSSDSDGSIITWDWNCTSHPGLTISIENSSAPEFTPTSAGIYDFTLTIMDDRGGWAVEDSVAVTVIDPNQRPKVNAGEDFTAYLDELTYLNGSASIDIDGTIVTWDWNSTSHISLYMNNENSSTPSFFPFETGTYVFTLQVKDNLGLWSGLDIVNVTVIDGSTNIIPVSSAGADFSVYVNTTVKLDGSNSSDEDGSIVTWLWNCTSHPGLSFTNLNSSQPTFYASEVEQYSITLQVKDNNEILSTLDTIIITVLPEQIVPPPPSENHPPIVTLDSGFIEEKLSGSVSITWIASDSDGDSLSFTIELMDPDGEVVNTLADGLESTTRSWLWDTESQDDGDYQIRIMVSDGTDTADDTSGEFNIKNKVSDVKDDETSSSIFTTGLGLGLILMIIIIIIILIVIVLVLKSKKNEQPPTSDTRVDQPDYYGHPPPTSEPIEDPEQELIEPQEQWQEPEQEQEQVPEQDKEIEPSDEQILGEDSGYVEDFDEEFEEDPVEETGEDIDLENDPDLEQDSELVEEPEGLTTDELEEPFETDDLAEDNVEVEDSSSEKTNESEAE